MEIDGTDEGDKVVAKEEFNNVEEGGAAVGEEGVGSSGSELSAVSFVLGASFEVNCPKSKSCCQFHSVCINPDKDGDGSDGSCNWS